MRVSREQAAKNRERILDVAAKRFRERGFDGIGVADLMKDVGLTHGGFYGHFSSKEDLMAQACAHALGASLANLNRLAEIASGNPLSALVERYLSAAHRDRPGDGCLFAALSPEVSRQGPAVRHAFTHGLRSTLAVFAGLIRGRSAAAKRQRGLATFASLVGAVVLARAVDDPALSDEILKAVSASVQGRNSG
jgi:TetR/AcrR family transcriptional regulator, transcriptional repressor for nem operon